ncbi:putative GTPase [Cystobacter fuscus DSM 2262]|uniref:Small ribosomal subunit biogenesis GTPase RsgA n=1 Tax=Cystobacter fuscus (strain ATCC 25194 / DSM 2262 / NBRC 100088 / M29) TaxID=1242864 RepID=S9PEG0_CYSF2|nr:ribosome small subunit-dependent GTPase A [Cystobacter fuscus]EPX62770.1 putative GTPase [Cystobacter fuscus DSM 2262]
MFLESLGWGPSLAHAFSVVLHGSSLSLVPGRVVRQERGLLTVQTSELRLLARPSGRLLHHASGAQALPTVGDWVALQPPSGPGEALIHEVLPRRGVLMRREADSEHEGQLIAANLDVVFLVTGLDGNFNPRRIERALTLAWSSGASPVVVLSKTDLDPEVAERVREVEALAPEVPVLALSAHTGEGLEALRAHLPPATTGALLGSSGVGKSTLVNHLLGEQRLATREVRPEDDKGRHTTTHRELFLLPHGGLLIDGPGMRELGLWGAEEEGLGQAFADVVALAAHCHFRDCTHRGEPRCAVRAAVDEGTLDGERLESFEKLRREQAYHARQSDAAARREHQRHVKNLTQAGRERSRSKRRGD